MKPILYSQHAIEQMFNREVSKEEVESAIIEGEITPAKKGRLSFRKNFPFKAEHKGKYYEIKQVMPIVVEENDCYIVITVYAFYFGG
ncbi:TPA: DUF4258 domain-containing protein [Candidatus Poribacteria bacterium]|nr:DUF4258 domain-containing protein [Candidatus Poribacteria bacterium]